MKGVTVCRHQNRIGRYICSSHFLWRVWSRGISVNGFDLFFWELPKARPRIFCHLIPLKKKFQQDGANAVAVIIKDHILVTAYFTDKSTFKMKHPNVFAIESKLKYPL